MEQIVVDVNEKRIALRPGSILLDALDLTGTKYVPGTIIGIVMGKEETKKEVATEFRIVTAKGEFRIELIDSPFKAAWLDFYGKLKGAGVKWANSHAVAIGPMQSSVQAGRCEAEYERWDVCLGTGGYDSKNTYLIISKSDHYSDYGVKGGGKFARVISGKSALDSLAGDDIVETIEPVIKLERFTDKLVTTDLSIPLKSGMEIFTEIEVEMNKKAKDGAEHFYSAVKDRAFRVDFTASSLISTDMMIGELCPYEHLAARSEGAISVRTDGSGRGRIYISKADMTSNIYHSVVGYVTKGMELVKMASEGHNIAVRTIPERFSVLGYPLKEAEEFLNKAGIKYTKTGYEGPDALVVEQEPKTTMEVMSTGNVKIYSILSGNLLEVKLYPDDAPKSVEYFKRTSGLKEYKVGSLSIFFKYEDTLLLKGKAVTIIELVPENKPEEGATVKSGQIGLTNMSAKHSGMLGVRFSDSTKFGPTGEKFLATNILGHFVDMEKMRKVKEKEKIYFKEV
jgi:putative methanogenesis marker protein 3